MKLIYSTGGCGLSKEQKLTAARTKNRDQNAYRELCFSSFMRTETERPRRDAPGSTPGTISHQHLRGHSLLLIRSVRGREFFFKGPQGFGERTQCPLKHTLCH